MDFLIVSGMSGAGKSLVANHLEDIGFYCIDNMPVELIPPFAEMCLASQGRFEKVALVTDVRSGQGFDGLFASLDLIRAMNCQYKILYIEARTETILRRYKETRRRHPLAVNGESIEQAVSREYELLAEIRSRADYIIDTSASAGPALREQLFAILSAAPTHPMVVTVYSFGFKYGLPQEADLVFDVRFLPNPYHIPLLRPLSGKDASVQEFVLNWPQATEFMDKLKSLADFLLPQYIREGKAGLVIAIGCTGGRHRSVTVAQALYDYLNGNGYHAVLSHRDITKDIGFSS